MKLFCTLLRITSMKAITAKSKRTLLLFLSAITLTLVLAVSAPTRINKNFSSTQIVQVLELKEIRKIALATTAIVGVSISALVAIPTLRPWTGSVLARAPPSYL